MGQKYLYLKNISISELWYVIVHVYTFDIERVHGREIITIALMTAVVKMRIGRTMSPGVQVYTGMGPLIL